MLFLFSRHLSRTFSKRMAPRLVQPRIAKCNGFGALTRFDHSYILARAVFRNVLSVCDAEGEAANASTACWRWLAEEPVAS